MTLNKCYCDEYLFSILEINNVIHCVKSVRIQSFSGPQLYIRTVYEALRSKSLYSVRMRENTDRKNV